MLGPLLFLIFINDLSDGLISNVRLYADDCVVYHPVQCAEDASVLQSDLEKICSWCDKWKMNLNIAKCYHVQFTNKKNKVSSSYFLNNVLVQCVNEVKYLGVTLTATLDWTSHIDKTCAKACRLLHFFQRNFKCAPKALKETLYLTNIRPIVQYACAAWDPFTIVLEDKLERVQKRAVRFVTGKYDYQIRSSQIRQELGWKLLSTRRKIIRLKLLYNIYSGNTGIDTNIYIKQPHYHSKRRDNSRKIRPYQCRIKVFKFSFFPRTIEEWNLLPDDIVCAPNFSSAIENFL